MAGQGCRAAARPFGASLGDAVWFVALEGKHVDFWLSVYEHEQADTSTLQDAPAKLVETVLGAPE